MADVAGAAVRSQAPAPVLAAGMEFCGILVLPGPARIDGRVRGEVIAGGPLWIGETGVIEADLEGDRVVVAGRVEGDVTATSRIEVRSSATVLGGLWAPRLVLAEGSTVNGPCRCGVAPKKSAKIARSAPAAP
jgi:cytoskeletal protein CcmA (bactofilin family)